MMGGSPVGGVADLAGGAENVAGDESHLGTGTGDASAAEFSSLRDAQAGLGTRLETLGTRLETVEQQGTATSERVARQDNDINGLNTRTTATEGAITRLEPRVNAAEQRGAATSQTVGRLNERANDLDTRTTRLEQSGAPQDRPITENSTTELAQYQAVADKGRPPAGTNDTNPAIALRRGNLDRAINEMRAATDQSAGDTRGRVNDPGAYRQARDRAGANASQLESAQNHERSAQETRTLGRRTATAIWVGSIGGVAGTAGAATTGALIAQNNRRQYDKGN